mgnify:CR=1 FL=1
MRDICYYAFIRSKAQQRTLCIVRAIGFGRSLQPEFAIAASCLAACCCMIRFYYIVVCPAKDWTLQMVAVWCVPVSQTQSAELSVCSADSKHNRTQLLHAQTPRDQSGFSMAD